MAANEGEKMKKEHEKAEENLKKIVNRDKQEEE